MDIKFQCGHRMSDTPDATNTTADAPTGSLFSNLKNKVAYNLHKATYDPNANQFAEEQKKQQTEATKKKDENPKDSTDNVDKGDPNKFSAKRLATKVGNQTWDIIQKIFFFSTTLSQNGHYIYIEVNL